MTLGRTNINLPEIPLNQKKYLYKRGNEYSDLTGGWSTSLLTIAKAYDASYTMNRGGVATKNEDNLEINLLSETANYRYCSVSTQNTINMEGYKTLNVRFDIIARTNLASGKSSWFTMYLLPKVEGNLEPNDVIARAELSNEVKDGLLVSLDISNMGGREVVVAIGNMIGSNQDVKYHAKIREVWLEP